MGIFDRFRKPPDGGQDPPAEPPALPPAGHSAPGLPTPLSDLMTRVLQERTEEAWRAFGEAFLRSRVGVVAGDAPGAGGEDAALGPIAQTPPEGGEYVVPAGAASLGTAATPDGRVMLLACADRDAFAQKFHDRFNREVTGLELAQAALVIAGCDGILVNSAASYHSLALDRARLASLVVRG